MHPNREASGRDLSAGYFSVADIVTKALITLTHKEAPGAPGAHYGASIVQGYLGRIAHSLECFRLRYVMKGRLPDHYWPSEFSIHNGLPISQQWWELAGDLEALESRLASTDKIEDLERKILDHCLNKLTLPRDLQFRLSERLYLESLTKKPIFLPKNEPQYYLLSKPTSQPRRYLLHWAVFDSERNLPNLYFSLIEESGDQPLHEKDTRWLEYSEALMNQSLSSLTLLTIAQGLDRDFSDIHPLTLRRIHAGPLYIHENTHHSNVIRQILDEQSGRLDQSWMFEWTAETLVSKDNQQVSSGLFRRSRRETYHVDSYSPELVSAGASSIERFMIMPIGPYQSLCHLNDPLLNSATKYVVGQDGTVLDRI